MDISVILVGMTGPTRSMKSTGWFEVAWRSEPIPLGAKPSDGPTAREMDGPDLLSVFTEHVPT